MQLSKTAVSVLLSIPIAILSVALCASCFAQEGKTTKEECAKFGGIAPPKHRLVRQWRTDLAPRTPVLFVSVTPPDVTRDSMIALGCHFGRVYSSESALDVYILDNQHAAKIFSPVEGTNPEAARALRAVYEFSREKGQHWMDFRAEPNSKWIHIDLGKPPETVK